MPSEFIKSFQAPPRNWDPRSIMTVSGIPNRGSHSWMKARQHEVEAISLRGYASGHLENRSTIVNRYLKPSLESGKGPTRSTWIDPNLLSAGGRTDRVVRVWRPIFAVWQGKQVRHHSRTCLRIPGQTYLEETSLMVGRLPP